MKNINIEIGKRLKERRLKQGLSQEQFAERIGIHRTYVGSIERGEKAITVKTLNKICKSLDTNLSEFLKNIS